MIDREEMAEWAQDNLRIIISQKSFNSNDATVSLEVFDGADWITIEIDYISIPKEGE